MELLVEGPISVGARCEAELLEEPRSMTEMPFCRTDFRDCLNDLILNRERRRELEAQAADAPEAIDERLHRPGE